MSIIPQLKKKEGTALVLSGGATKAFYFHLGVLKTLQLQDVTSIVGSSAGAVMGGFIAAGATVDELLTSLYQKRVYLPKFDSWIKTLTSSSLFQPRCEDMTRQGLYTAYSGLKFLASLPRLYNRDLVAEVMDMLVNSQSQMSGFFDAVALENLFRGLLPSTDFSSLDIDLYVIATCLDCNRRVVFNGGYNFETEDSQFVADVPIPKAVHASTSIPGLFDPVKINGRYFIDGEVKRTLSADIGFSLADKVIISHTYQPLNLYGQGSVRDLGWVNVLKQTVNMVLHERIAVWRKLYAQEYPDKEVLWIQPEEDDIDFFVAPEFSFRPEVQKELIKSGEVAAMKALGKAQPVRT